MDAISVCWKHGEQLFVTRIGGGGGCTQSSVDSLYALDSVRAQCKSCKSSNGHSCVVPRVCFGKHFYTNGLAISM